MRVMAFAAVCLLWGVATQVVGFWIDEWQFWLLSICNAIGVATAIEIGRGVA